MLMDLAAQLRSLPIKHRSKSSELTWIVIALPADARDLPEGFFIFPFHATAAIREIVAQTEYQLSDQPLPQGAKSRGAKICAGGPMNEGNSQAVRSQHTK